MYNKIILIGNLTRDIEIRSTRSGTSIASTGIATNRKFKDVMGEAREETMFIDLSFFGRTADIAQRYLHRGSRVLIEGRLKLNQWTDAAGNRRSKHSVDVETMKMLDSREEREASGQERVPHPQASHTPPRPAVDTKEADGWPLPQGLSDEELQEIPF